MSLESMLSALTTSEKFDAMNILWRDLSRNASEFKSPDWHGNVLADRMANPSSNPKLPLDAAIQDAKERLNARQTQEWGKRESCDWSVVLRPPIGWVGRRRYKEVARGSNGRW